MVAKSGCNIFYAQVHATKQVRCIHRFVEANGHAEELLIIAEHPLREVGTLPAGVSQILCPVKVLLCFTVTAV